MNLPQRVRIVEVGPRDGLQNETAIISVTTKAELIERLAAAGLWEIEAGSFVSHVRVPQMATTRRVIEELEPSLRERLDVLTPNLRGLEEAITCGVGGVAVFAAASRSFSLANIGCTVEESLDRFAPVVEAALSAGLRVRGYISCALGCPYEGDVAPRRVAALARDLAALGCEEISLGDTIGVGAPIAARRLVEEVARDVPLRRLAVHFHDTYGQALANIFACLELGVDVVDSSIAGLGGCPFAPGATGNVATEDVVYMLERSGVETGVDLTAAIAAGDFISERLGRANRAKTARALQARRQREDGAA
ncbi:hydroxymethylglutaryl-CoA lyase [Methylosinus sp. Sm6]|uniref:hydroxymethylglutaryl-CoA lyase n=1 Tax=Methylosinus sp. Sm6 TaxID=2866948 RepID=UPI001C996673|nr:hydroxymethylglutaryl-CoA lyase [Methylosinus sp. Sm6]MBY6241777.1 hydroxymethylglutaryl-CoA lyase [Methylosinus sp. Sm6]